MGKTWTTTRRGDVKDFVRWLRKGATVYVITTPDYAGNSRLWNHPRYWTAHTCTGQHPLIGSMQVDGTSAEDFLRWHGTVYEDQPRNIPHVSDPGRDCRDEGLYPIGRGQEYKGNVHDSIGAMAELGNEARDRYKKDRSSGRRSWGFR
ncbi:hypothetical protein PL81_38860 [Streptomyces sp. RSD-27]|nr:hypothetical protein PL81_38860 [Streptomyces sp. RSD-27]